MHKNMSRVMSFILTLTLVLTSYMSFGDSVITYGSSEENIVENIVEVISEETINEESQLDSFEEEGKHISIIHTNDIHGRVEEGKLETGISKLATKVKELRNENPGNVLLLDAGDTLHGLPIVGISKGKAMVDIMNTVGYDLMTLGNHDFNYGKDRLVELSKKANFKILAANIYKENGERLFKPYDIKEIDGIKIGIFGLATPETLYKTNPKNVEGLDFRNPVEEAEKIVKELDGEVDIIVALSHLGLDKSSKTEDTSDSLARNVEGIDIIIDGHSHTTLEEGKVVNGVLIAQTGDYTKNIGVVDIVVKDNKEIVKKARLINKEEMNDLEDDKEVKKVIDSIKIENDKITSIIVGETEVNLDGVRENVRTKETNLGNLIADAMIDITGADIAITNGGGIRASIDKGNITRGDIITVLPFGNYIIVKEVKGLDILKAIEHGISKYPDSNGAFPQIGGIELKFDPSKKVGEKVMEIKVGKEELDLNKTYKLATNDFMAVGGDGYTMFKDYEINSEYSGLDEVLISYIEKQGKVKSTVNGRIIVSKGKNYKDKKKSIKFYRAL